MAKQGQHNAPGEKRAGTINVIFRGLFLFVERLHYIDVLIPNMGSAHVYRAGSFLCETTLAPRLLKEPYRLTGVRHGKGRFQQAISGYDHLASLGAEEVHARIVLPRPKEILSLRPTVEPIRAEPDPLQLAGRKVHAVHILSYETEAMDAVQLFPHWWKTHPQPNPFGNLHIVCEPDGEAAYHDGHPVLGLDKTISLIAGLAEPEVIDPSPMRVGEQQVDPKPGVSWLETLSLAELREVLLNAAEDWRAGKAYRPKPKYGLLPPFDCTPLVIRPT